MKKYEITHEVALREYKAADQSGRKAIVKLIGMDAIPDDIKEWVQTFEDACMIIGIDPNLESFRTGTPDEIAYKKLKVIVRALNTNIKTGETWEPDWENGQWDKYYPWFKMGSAGVGFSTAYYADGNAGSCVGSRLCFKTSDLAMYAGKQFESIYKDFMTI